MKMKWLSNLQVCEFTDILEFLRTDCVITISSAFWKFNKKSTPENFTKNLTAPSVVVCVNHPIAEEPSIIQGVPSLMGVGTNTFFSNFPYMNGIDWHPPSSYDATPMPISNWLNNASVVETVRNIQFVPHCLSVYTGTDPQKVRPAPCNLLKLGERTPGAPPLNPPLIHVHINTCTMQSSTSKLEKI